MLKHGRAGVPMEVMGLMLGEFVDDYTVRVIDVFAMPQSGTVRTTRLFGLMYRDLFNVTGWGGGGGIGVLGMIIVPPLRGKCWSAPAVVQNECPAACTQTGSENIHKEVKWATFLIPLVLCVAHRAVRCQNTKGWFLCGTNQDRN